ncbi:unnamed protein product [Hydatigera taeniaeformis]|uniref:Radial spoke head protein 4 A n=1 Tax=Hydatigena taeniaeformis TaxID=6205 RepID=A0A0R3WMS2_HYDTA|nr:unnamed protein product [Hydatigera taeniaeformis]
MHKSGRFMKESEPTDEDIIVQDIYGVASKFVCTGEGLDASECFKLKIAFKKIDADYPIESIRFWGKIFGTHNDYYIIECIPGDSSIFEDNAGNETIQEDNDLNSREPVQAIFNICSHLTGDLTATVDCFPPFPGTEAHYLRAQVARISAATQLAPQNFFQLRQDDNDDGGEEEEEDEEMVQVECEENEEYVAQPLDEMELEQWVHCRPYILPQGRVTWWNPLEVEDETGSESGSTGDDNKIPPLRGFGVEHQPERGPPILTPITEDLEVHGQVPWTIRRFPGGLYLRISSLLWPGAHTIAWEGAFENVYVGWGLKATGPGGFQTTLPAIQHETIEEPVEQTDPTPEEEAAKEEGKSTENGENSEDGDDDYGEDEEEEEEEEEEDM